MTHDETYRAAEAEYEARQAERAAYKARKSNEALEVVKKLLENGLDDESQLTIVKIDGAVTVEYSRKWGA